MTESFRMDHNGPPGDVTRLISAAERPDRVLYAANSSGNWQVFAWDRSANVHRQLTNHSHGVNYFAISPNGERVVWFADPDGGERGEWKEQAFADGPGDEQSLMPDGFGPRYPQGIEVGNTTTVAAFATTNGRFSVHKVSSGEATELHASSQPIVLRGMSPDELLIALQDSTRHDDFERPQTRVLSLDDEQARDRTVAVLDHGPGREVVPIGFLGTPDGGHRLLVQYEDAVDRCSLLLWNPATGEETALPAPPEGELGNRWDVCCYRMLVKTNRAGRVVAGFDEGANTRLYELDPATQSVTRIPTPDGTIDDFGIAPDGTVEYLWGTVRDPWRYRRVDDRSLPFAHRKAAHLKNVEITLTHVDGADDPVPTYVVTPGVEPPPAGYPTVVWVHGGPRIRVGNEPLPPVVEELLAHGCQIAVPVYRGSRGNGNRWRDANYGRSGVVEVEDVAAVVQHLKAAPNVDPGRIAGVGSSYGGYVLLLVAGKHLDLLSAVSVSSPLCDPEGMFNDPGVRPEFRASLRRRYGGTPEQAPENWRRASPLTYAHAIRCQVQLTDNKRDPRCLVTLNDKFIGAAVDAGVSIEMRRLSGGHNKTHQTGEVQETILGEQIRFLSDVLDLVPVSPSLPTAPDGGRPQLVSRREPPSRGAGRAM